MAGRSAVILAPLVGGLIAFAAFLLYERRAPEPMLEARALLPAQLLGRERRDRARLRGPRDPLLLSSSSSCRRWPGYSALESGLHDRSGDARHVRALASIRRARRSPRPAPVHVGSGPSSPLRGSCSCCGQGMDTPYLTVVLPALLLFGVGLSMTVAPLTAAVLAGADETDAGHRVGGQQRRRPRREPDRRLSRRRRRREDARRGHIRRQRRSRSTPSTRSSSSAPCWSPPVGSRARSGSRTRDGRSRPRAARAASSSACPSPRSTELRAAAHEIGTGSSPPGHPDAAAGPR